MLSAVVDLHNVVVAELRERDGLSTQALLRNRAVEATNTLDGDPSIEGLVVTQVHLPHAAFAEVAIDPVLADAQRLGLTEEGELNAGEQQPMIEVLGARMGGPGDGVGRRHPGVLLLGLILAHESRAFSKKCASQKSVYGWPNIFENFRTVTWAWGSRRWAC